MYIDFIVAVNFSKLSLLILSLPWIFQNKVRSFYRGDEFFKIKFAAFIVALNC